MRGMRTRMMSMGKQFRQGGVTIFRQGGLHLYVENNKVPSA